jgi:hypothetical protein
MPLPQAIPKNLRIQSIDLPELKDGEGAWAREHALGVLTSLEGTSIGICDIAVFDRAPWGYTPSGTAWSIDRSAAELFVDYAHRSRVQALELISSLDDPGNSIVVSLTFHRGDEAA